MRAILEVMSYTRGYVGSDRELYYRGYDLYYIGYV